LFSDDVFTFKRDAEECFKLFSSLRGKKRDYPGLVNFFATLMEDNFPGVFDLAAVETTAPVSVMGSSRKRGRHEVEDPQESVPELKKTPSRTKQAEIETDPALSNEFRLTYNEKVFLVIFHQLCVDSHHRMLCEPSSPSYPRIHWQSRFCTRWTSRKISSQLF
jgi:hypothetical protein